ncbi:MAG: NAD-dependent epimerase/dehydratase family protein [Planctomycetota bacterium]
MNVIHRSSKMFQPENVLVVGAGYLGLRVASRVAEIAKTATYATTRSRRRFFELSEAGLVPLKFDWTDPQTFSSLPLGEVQNVLVAVSFDRRSGVDRYSSQVGGLVRLLRCLSPTTRVCYISTTGVYHQSDGRWVDETSPTRPKRLGGKVHLAAESRFHALIPKQNWVVLRLAGIYGPGRIPRAADVIAGNPIRSSPDGFLNLIHVEDAVRATLAAWEQMVRWGSSPPIGPQSRLFVVGDDRPSPRRMFYQEIATLTGSEGPRFLPPGDQAPERSRSDSNKRVCNRKLKRLLLSDLHYPDYRSGLADILR